MATTISTQDIIDAKRDIEDIGKAVNENVIVSPRYGDDFKSLPMISAELQDAINTIVIDDGVPDSVVSTWSGRTQEEKNKEQISILDFGGKAQAGFDNSTAINNAYAYSESVGGCTIHIPFSGSGTYEVKSKVYAKSNTTFIIDDGVLIDATSLKLDEPTDVNDAVWNISGSFVGSEIPLSANATSGDTTIKANNHGLQVGDYALLKSQRNAFSIADSGQDWWLGRATGSLNAHACYFGEPIEVLSVVSANEFTIRNPLVFPDYRTDKAQETNSLARSSATIQKMNFIKDSFVIGGSYKLDGSTMFKEFISLNCGVQKTKCDLGANVGSAIQAIYSLYHVNTDNEAVHSAEDYLIVDHSQYNSFKDKSSWYGTWSYTDRYGMQGLDMTYIPNRVCSIQPHTIYARTYNNNENSIITHGGVYGYTIDSVLAINNKQSPVFLRSRGGVIGQFVLISRYLNGSFVSTSEAGIDVQMLGGYIEGSLNNTSAVAFNIGALTRYDNSPFTDNQPYYKNVDVQNVKIKNVTRLGNIRNGVDNPANSEITGVGFSNITASNYTHGFRVWSYNNAVIFNNIKGYNGADNSVLISFDNNSIDHTVSDIYATHGSTVRLPLVNDLTTFPKEVHTCSNISMHNIRKRDGSSGITNALNTTIPFTSYAGMRLDGRIANAGSLLITSTNGSTVRVGGSPSEYPMNKPIIIYSVAGANSYIEGESGVVVHLGQTGHNRVEPNKSRTLTLVSPNIWVLN